MTLDDIKARCFIDDEGHWIWKGANNEGKYPHVWAPDYSKDGAPMCTQTGRRAVWHLKTKQPIQKGWRVYGTCGHTLCLNPKHMACGPVSEWGKHLRDTGIFKNKPKRIAANRAIGQKLAKTTPESIADIMGSDESGLQIAERIDLSPQLISRVRNGKAGICWEPVGGIFSGLLAANETSKRRA